MREILFRGKRTNNGEWIEGYLYSISEEYNPFIMLRNRCAESYQVDSETVGQYTGMTDKNGVKIFEGDIMELEAYGKHYKGHVEIVSGNASIVCKNVSPFLDDAIDKYVAQIIGNIHDNPELLGDKDGK